MIKRNTTHWIAASLAALALLSGCESSDSGSDPALVRTFNAVADSEPLDVLISEQVTAAAVAPGTLTGYVEADEGQRVIRVRSTSTGNANIVQATANLFGDQRHTVILRGLRSSIGLVMLGDETADPAAGKFKLRVANVAFDPAVYDIYVGNGDIATATPTFAGLAYASLVDYTELDFGDKVVVFTLAGTKDVVFRSGTINFAALEKATLLIYPSRGSRLVNAAVLRSSSGGVVNNPLARARLVNGIPGAVLDLKAGGTVLTTGTVYSGNSPYAETAAGAVNLQVEATNVPGSALATASATLDPGRDNTALAWGTLSQPRLTLLPDDNTVAASGTARLRVVNALADNTPVDVLVNFVSRNTALAAGTASSYGPVPSGRSHTVTFTAAGGTAVIASVDTASLASAGVYTVFLVGSVAAPVVRVVTDR